MLTLNFLAYEMGIWMLFPFPPRDIVRIKSKEMMDQKTLFKL